MTILRLCLLTCVFLVPFATANIPVCFVEAASPGIDQISSRCLSCHENINNPNSSSHSGSHVIGIDYADYVAGNERLRPVIDLPAGMVLFEGVITCASCHGANPHDGQSLVITNRGSALCSACHLK